LVFYRQTQDELAATLILSLLWVFFWKESDLLGKVFLVSASIIGYAHELIGVQAGYFTYLGGFFGGVPIWILPGYGVMFWASYHFWSVFEKKYAVALGKGTIRGIIKRIYANASVSMVILTAAIFALDIVFFDFMQTPFIISLEFILVVLLWRSLKDARVAYFVAFFTVFDEFAGEALGVWSHPVFSLVSLATAYMFSLWMSMTITDILHKKKVWMAREVLGAAGVLVIFAINTYLRISGAGGF
ncbi:MAG: hypothetical protein KAJ24_07545, partial [Candidatus Aenigmarchaeota archaeon]|nr:hypothetical protein [Candidatus Aenigmarchaeota archaeon]